MKKTMDKNIRLAIIGLTSVVAIFIAVIMFKKVGECYGRDKR